MREAYMASAGFVCLFLVIIALGQKELTPRAVFERDWRRADALAIAIAPALEPCVGMLRERSTTFRDLYTRLAHNRDVSIAISLAVRRPGRLRAKTRISRSPGHLAAMVTIFTASDWPELIAHELQHVREQAFGISIRLLALTRAPGVWGDDSSGFETRQAIEVGERVAREVHGRGMYPCSTMPLLGLTAPAP
jgi:hypothetical protein